ncbi:Glycogen debranching enzyme [Penicillium chermesinum]|nr:Glycogen debranching enzyme [Penicillium chermesinum]
MSSSQVYLLPLKDDGSPDVPGGYIYLPSPTDSGYILRFIIEGTSSICRQGSLWVNIPEDKAFDRQTFREFRLQPNFNENIQIDIPIKVAGSFAYYATFTPLPSFSVESVPTSEPTKTPIHYIDVSPRLTLQGKDLPLNALSIFSVISKFMGQYPVDWDKHLHGISQRNYNMVHFTPLMARGASNSPYSIFDQLTFDSALFPNGESDVASLVSRMEKEYGLLTLTDVVWNHTAHNSKWLEEHPEAGYSVETAPWLESALELDTALLKFSDDLESLGLPTEFKSVDDLVIVMNALRKQVIDSLRLWEYYALDVKASASEIKAAWTEGKADQSIVQGDLLSGFQNMSLKDQAQLVREHGIPNYKQVRGRFERKVDASFGAAILTILHGDHDLSSSNLADAEASLAKLLDAVNLPLYEEYDTDLADILDQLFNRTKYLRIDDHGPKLGPVTKESPLIESYFTRLPINEVTKKHNPKALALANNGWIWNADAMRDNAGPDSKAYLRREVIVWGDCVKLRYGNSPKDSPFLWDFMTKYTRLMAKYFSGFRIDNCHSTPLVVAEYLLDEARQVRPNLTVFAELFTGSEEADYIFVKRLGISALIREAMQPWSTAELSRLVHRHGGRPIGSFDVDLPTAGSSHAIASAKAGGSKENITHIRPTPVQALFMDCTHDNEVPAQKRDPRDTLPNAALVAMCASAIGSVMGYDEVYPKLVDLVHETRQYESPFSGDQELQIGAGDGIGGVKKLLNQLHTMMGVEGYDETHIHHDGEYITVHRVHPKTRKGIFLIAHTAFPGNESGAGLSPTHITGTQAKHLGSWVLAVDAGDDTKSKVLSDEKLLKGLPSHTRDVNGTNIEGDSNDVTITVLESLVPGSIALFETWIPSTEHADGLENFISSGADEAFSELSLVDLNFVLYRCDAEERDSSDGRDGVYTIPNHGPLVYAGLQGWWSVLEDIIKYNQLGHPLCDHLRDGQWALDYVVGRMANVASKEGFAALNKPSAWLREKFDAVRGLPNFLLPRYFAIIVQVAYNAAWKRGIHQLSDNVRHGQEFVHQLAMVSIQQTGYVNSASLWPTKQVPSLAAGLPHFAVDWARCWGRDVFISLRGLFLCTGRFEEAKEHIFAFASVLKHGMIPNLLSSGKLPRYNSRDSVWFFLETIQDYVKMAPNGIDLLKEKSSTILEIIQEVFQRHARGMSFREYNAGPALDVQMKPEGFDIEIKVDWETGIIFGGSQWNCGTWQDKMGESAKAGNKGFPGHLEMGLLLRSPDSYTVPYLGLPSYNNLRFTRTRALKSAKESRLPSRIGLTSSRVTLNGAILSPLTPRMTANTMWMPASSTDVESIRICTSLESPLRITSFGRTSPLLWQSHHPLFTPENALKALSIADEAILGPVGVATLDPSDLNYRPYYVNSDDSDDFATAKGRNYHQGPEWVWPRGYFLRALLHFDLKRRETPEGRIESFQQITRRLDGCKKALRESPWRGLHELTNKNGEECRDSSPTQSWSAGCLLDLYYDATQVS